MVLHSASKMAVGCDQLEGRVASSPLQSPAEPRLAAVQ